LKDFQSFPVFALGISFGFAGVGDLVFADDFLNDAVEGAFVERFDILKAFGKVKKIERDPFKFGGDRSDENGFFFGLLVKS